MDFDARREHKTNCTPTTRFEAGSMRLARREGQTLVAAGDNLYTHAFKSLMCMSDLGVLAMQIKERNLGSSFGGKAPSTESQKAES